MKTYTDKGTIEDAVDVRSKDGIDTAECVCGGKSFFVSYGDYVCIGTCTQCGKDTELYSG